MLRRWNTHLFIWMTCIVMPLVANTTYGETLHGAVEYTLKTNPHVLISIKQRLQADQRFKESRAGFLPTIDVGGQWGPERTKNFSTVQQSVDLVRRNRSFELTENIFRGYETIFNIKADLARISASAYRVNDTSQNTALAVIEVYLNVMRTRSLLAVAQQNVNAHKRTAKIIALRVEKGLSNAAELQQSQGRLALAESNLYNEINNYQDAISEYIEVVGKSPEDLQLSPQLISHQENITKDNAIEIALKKNPTLISTQFNLFEAVARHKATYSAYFPSVDIVLSSNHGENVGGLEGDNFNDSAYVRMNFNLYRGGEDLAKLRQTAYQKEEAFEEIRKTQREVTKNTSLAWSAWQIDKIQIAQLKTHMVKSKFVVGAFKMQYVVSKRTLVDLLNAESEYFTARRSYIDGRFSLILNHYRLLNQMGILLEKLNISLPKTAYTPDEAHQRRVEEWRRQEAIAEQESYHKPGSHPALQQTLTAIPAPSKSLPIPKQTEQQLPSSENVSETSKVSLPIQIENEPKERIHLPGLGELFDYLSKLSPPIASSQHPLTKHPVTHQVPPVWFSLANQILPMPKATPKKPLSLPGPNTIINSEPLLGAPVSLKTPNKTRLLPEP